MKFFIVWPLRILGALFWALYMLAGVIFFKTLIGLACLLLAILRYLNGPRP